MHLVSRLVRVDSFRMHCSEDSRLVGWYPVEVRLFEIACECSARTPISERASLTQQVEEPARFYRPLVRR
jgi:hypothetical protein